MKIETTPPVMQNQPNSETTLQEVTAAETHSTVNLHNEMNYDVYYRSCTECILLTFLTIIIHACNEINIVS